MPWALTCAGVGAAVADGEAFSERRGVARAVAEVSLAPRLARVPVLETGDAEARWAVLLAEDADGTRLMVASTTAEMTTPAVMPSARSAMALHERPPPDTEDGTAEAAE